MFQKQIRTRRTRPQKGFTMIEILVAVAIAIGFGIVVFQGVQGKKAETELNRTLGLISSDLPSALSAYYNTMNKTFVALTTGASNATGTNGAKTLVARYGLPETMATGDTWSITSSAAQALTFQFPCTNFRGADACSQLAAAVTAQNNPMITGSAATTTGCTNAGAGGASNCFVNITMVRPR